MRLLLLFFCFFIVGALFILSNGDLSLANKEETLVFGELYYTWLSELIENFNVISGQAVGLEWLPDINNSTG
jgi:hypothetical protein